MTNINDRKTNLENSSSRQPISGVTGTNETNMREGTTIDQAAYRDGYVHGRNLEQERLEAGQEVRDNDNAARGLLLGIVLTGLVGLTVGLTYFLSQRNQTPVQNPTIVVPRTAPSPSPQTSQPPQVIERDRIVPVPVPQQPPDVNITVPSAGQAPAAGSAPSVQTAPPSQSAPATQPAPSQPAPAQPGASSAPTTGTTQPDSTGGSSSTAPAPESAPSNSGSGSGQ
jgi:hypothetical protein